jgi:hypothetical protein
MKFKKFYEAKTQIQTERQTDWRMKKKSRNIGGKIAKGQFQTWKEKLRLVPFYHKIEEIWL